MKKAILIIIALLTLCSCKEGPSNRMSRQDLRDKLAYRTASGLATNESGESVTVQHAGGSADEINYELKVYTIMAGSFSAKESADQILIRANKVGYDGKVTMNSENNFVVHLAHSNDRDKVKEALEDLQARNIIPPDAFITVEK